MSCCGEKTKMEVFTDITEGFFNRTLERTFKKPVPPEVQEKLDVCYSCEHITYLSFIEFGDFFVKNAGTMMNNLHQLHKELPMPIKEKREGAFGVCSVCKCRVEEKARAKKSLCCKGKWS